MSLNPYCEIAVEEAVRQKAAGVFSNITGLAIGGPEYHIFWHSNNNFFYASNRTTETIRTALAMGLDQAIHVVTPKRTDVEISPIVVARIFKHFVNIQMFDVVLMGKLV